MWVGQSNDHGITDVHIRTEAPNAIRFDATIDRIADHLGLLGDGYTKDIRRGRAVGVIAQPQQTLDLFLKLSHSSWPGTDSSRHIVDTPPTHPTARASTM